MEQSENVFLTRVGRVALCRVHGPESRFDSGTRYHLYDFRVTSRKTVVDTGLMAIKRSSAVQGLPDAGPWA